MYKKILIIMFAVVLVLASINSVYADIIDPSKYTPSDPTEGEVKPVIKIGEKIIANPGSISKPRGGTRKSYIMIDEEKIELKTLDGELIKSIRIDNKFNA